MKILGCLLFLLSAGGLATVSHAAELQGWWLHINDRVAYERTQADAANACQVVPRSAPVFGGESGGPDLTDAMEVKSNGDIFDCNSFNASSCAHYKDFRVDFNTGKVISTTDPNCSGQIDILPNGNIRFAGGCKGDYDQAELFHVTEEGYRTYIDIARKCPAR